MFGSGRTLLAVCLTALAGNASSAQSDAHPHLLAFTDTNSVRVEVTIPNADSLNGAALKGRITRLRDSSVLWTGALGRLTVGADGVGRLTARIAAPGAHRWSPQSPELYRLVVLGQKLHGDYATAVEDSIRFGFRSVATHGGQILLNGRPIFLKGNAINPPERNIPDSLEENRRFVEPYIRYLKSVGVNIIRLTRHSQVWFDVGDELGMMFFQGNYGTPQGGKPTQAPTRPLSESVAWYKTDVLGPLVNHPSVVVYVLTNEQADKEIGYLTTGAEGMNRFLGQMYDSLSTWDRTRVYIANAGYGFGRVGDICDLHRYWGWYYNSFLSFYTMRSPATCWRRGIAQPMTMTENTGNYTGVDGRFNLVSNTKQPDSQLNWTGHAPDSEQSRRALAYQAWMGGQAIEIYRRSREQNPNLAGLTPFTILFHNWYGIAGFQDMHPKPLGAQYGISYQPVLLSWELWSSQVYAGTTIKPVVHVVNDDEQGRDLTRLALRYTVSDSAGKTRQSGYMPFGDVRYYEAKSRMLPIGLDRSLPTGTYTLSGAIVRGADSLSHNSTKFFVAGAGYKTITSQLPRTVAIYDPKGASVKALANVGVRASRVSSVSEVNASRDLFVIGADGWDARLAGQMAALKSFIADGGRVLVLHQDPARFDGSWLPVPIRLQKSELDHALVFPGGRPFRNGMSVNPERPEHALLNGIDRDRLFLWSDFTNWNEKKPGFPQVYPVTRGFILTDPGTFGNAAVIANYDHGLEGIALAELFGGTGSALVTGFDVVNRSGLDPIADRMLGNMVRWMASSEQHQATQLVSDRITWGDYASEHGVVTGIYNGLLVNTVPIVPAALHDKYPISVDAEGFALAGGEGGWNTKPAIQYVARGRRPFGPYTFTSGGSVTVDKAHAGAGEGTVWLRIPASRTTMITSVENPVGDELVLTAEVNGAAQTTRIGAHATVRIETAVRGGDAPLAIHFRGDRRLVILSTEFR